MPVPAPSSSARVGPRTVVLALIALVLAAELVLRVGFGFGNPRIVETSARLGYRFYPGQTIAGPRDTTEHINAHGYRDEEWPEPGRAPEPAPLAIAVLGASVSYGTGVADESAWPRVLERELARAGAGGARKCDVVNLALPGYVLEQLARQYEDDVRSLAPAVVVVEVSPHSIRRAPVRADSRRFPFHTYVRRSAIYDLVQRRLVRHGPGDGLDPERSRLALQDPERDVEAGLWREAEARMDALLGALRADGARLVLLETPLLGAVLSDPTAGPGRWDTWAAAHPDVVRIRTAPALRVEMAELLEEIERRELLPERVWTRFEEPVALEHDARSLFFRDDPLHLTEAGHRVVAGVVLEGLGAAKLP